MRGPLAFAAESCEMDVLKGEELQQRLSLVETSLGALPNLSRGSIGHHWISTKSRQMRNQRP